MIIPVGSISPIVSVGSTANSSIVRHAVLLRCLVSPLFPRLLVLHLHCIPAA